jgi:hypothetical protein
MVTSSAAGVCRGPTGGILTKGVVHVPPTVAAVINYQGIFSSKDLSSVKSGVSRPNVTTVEWKAITEAISARGISLQTIKDNSNAILAAHKAAGLPLPPTGSVALKAPFWQRCDTASLSDVLKRVFHLG